MVGVIELGAQDLGLSAANVGIERVREVMYAPFTVPERNKDGRLVRVDNPDIQFGMIDSGAMVGCVS